MHRRFGGRRGKGGGGGKGLVFDRGKEGRGWDGSKTIRTGGKRRRRRRRRRRNG